MRWKNTKHSHKQRVIYSLGVIRGVYFLEVIMNLDEIFSLENLYEAYKNCRRSKQHKGEVIRFEVNLAVNLNTLHKQLITKTYKLGKYKKFYIYEPKKRLIEALPFKDRVMVRCFCDVCLKDKIEKKLIYDNGACRSGKGTAFSIKRLHEFLRREYLKENNHDIYFLKCDIHKYFPSINHDILISLLEEIDFSSDEMWLIKKLIKEQPDNANIGLPLGNQTSQWFALLYLNNVDRFIKEKLRIKGYVRYMDDMILLHRDKDYLRYCQKEIEKLCNDLLDLKLNDKTQIGMVKNGIDFLGYRHILTNTGKVIVKLRYSSKKRMKRHLKTVNKLYHKGIIDKEYVYQRKDAFYNHIKDTNDSMKYKVDTFLAK